MLLNLQVEGFTAFLAGVAFGLFTLWVYININYNNQDDEDEIEFFDEEE